MRVFLLFVFSSLPYFMALFYFLPVTPIPGFIQLMFLTKLFIALAPFFFMDALGIVGTCKEFPKLIFPRNQRTMLRQIGIGLTVGMAYGLLVYQAFQYLPEETRNFAIVSIKRKIYTLGIQQYFWIYGIVLSLLHSLLEEFYWRFFIFRAWKANYPFGIALVFSALAFALHHFVVTLHYFPISWSVFFGCGVWVGAILWNWIFDAERSLLGVWISHVLVDLALIAIGYQALK